jgi:hypothetical protein
MRVLFLLIVVSLVSGCAAHYQAKPGGMDFVYWNEGVGRAVENVGGADAGSFQQLKKGEYAKDKNHVYWRGTIISNAEPVTFELLVGRYAKDSKHVYLDQNVVEGADPETFQKLPGKEIWGQDKNDFYYGNEALHVSDPGSFIILNDGWAKDSHFYYYYAYGYIHVSRKVDCDYASMKILNDFWAKDARRAYYGMKPVEVLDLVSFHTVGEFEGKDKYRRYEDPGVERVKREMSAPAK